MSNRRILEVKSDRSMTDQGSRHSVEIEEMSLAGPLLSNTPGTVPHGWNTTCGNRVSRNLRLLTFPFFCQPRSRDKPRETKTLAFSLMRSFRPDLFVYLREKIDPID